MVQKMAPLLRADFPAWLGITGVPSTSMSLATCTGAGAGDVFSSLKCCSPTRIWNQQDQQAGGCDGTGVFGCIWIIREWIGAICN